MMIAPLVLVTAVLLVLGLPAGAVAAVALLRRPVSGCLRVHA
jgi:hypothetical protein